MKFRYFAETKTFQKFSNQKRQTKRYHGKSTTFPKTTIREEFEALAANLTTLEFGFMSH